jgi:hypothetical protein
LDALKLTTKQQQESAKQQQESAKQQQELLSLANNLVAEVGGVKKSVSQIKNDLGDLTIDVGDLEENADVLNGEFSGLSKRLATVEKEMKKLKTPKDLKAKALFSSPSSIPASIASQVDEGTRTERAVGGGDGDGRGAAVSSGGVNIARASSVASRVLKDLTPEANDLFDTILDFINNLQTMTPAQYELYYCRNKITMACDAVFEGVDVLNSKSYDSGIANHGSGIAPLMEAFEVDSRTVHCVIRKCIKYYARQWEAERARTAQKMTPMTQTTHGEKTDTKNKQAKGLFASFFG